MRLLAALAVAAALAAAQEPPSRTKGAVQGDTTIEAGDGLMWAEGEFRVLFLTGQVLVKGPDLEISAARAMAWTKEGTKRPVEQLYAEGNVILKRAGRTLRAEQLYFDLAGDRAVVVDLRAKASGRDPGQVFFVTAKEARMTFGRVETGEILLTTCSYGVPHFHFEVGGAKLVGKEERPRKSEGQDLWPFDDFDVEFDRIYSRMGGLPIFFLPGLSLGSWVRDFPVRSVSGGRSSRYGTYVYTELGLRIRKEVEGHKPRTWGEVIGEVDWREERGGGYGLDLRYGWGGYEGFIDTYFLHDQGRVNDVEFEQKFAPLEREERGRARAFHRQDLDEEWRFELEASYVSDRDLIEEFFEKEFKEGKQPETAAYVRWLGGGELGAFVLERHRINDFQTQNEYLPRVHADLLQSPVLGDDLGNLLLTERADVVHIRRRFDEDLHLESVETWRTDLITDLSAPWDLTIVQVAPFVQHRLTFYEDDLEGESELRSLWTAGGRLLTQIHGTHPDIAWEAVGLRGLRHVAEFEARYANTVDSNLETSDVFPFEETDLLGEFEEAVLKLRQRWLTRDEQGKPFEFMNATLALEYYPDSDRDTTSANADNTATPFHWIGVSPDAAGTYERRHWSNLNYDLQLHPGNFLRARLGGEYNPVSRHEEVREFGVVAKLLQGLSVGTSHTFVRGVTDAWTIEAVSELSPKWSASAVVQYDFRADEYVSQGLVVSRDCHDFLLQGVLEHDFGRDERRVYVAFVPTFLGKSGLKGSRLAKVGDEVQ